MTRRSGFVSLTIVAAMAAASPLAAPDAARSRLTKKDLEQVAQARAQGTEKVTVLVVVGQEKSTPAIAERLEKVGGIVRFREDAIGYLRAKVPLARVREIARWEEIAAIDLDVSVLVMDADAARTSEMDETTGGASIAERDQTPSSPSTPAQSTKPRPVYPPGSAVPLENAYLATRDMGAPQFIAAHPSFDGRGVTLGVIDGNPDLLLPAFRTATTLDGKPTRKIADVLVSTDPLEDRDPLWLRPTDEVTEAGDGFTYKDVTYHGPRNGTFRIALLDERKQKGLNGDLNRDGNPKGSRGEFAVLWDRKANEAWLDTDQDGDFRDEHAMMDYRVRGDVGIIGTDDPETPVRETVPFVIQTAPADGAIRITPSVGGHGTMVIGSAVGKGFFDGAFNGVAPEAQVVSISPGDTMQSIVEAFILAARDPRVDLFTTELGTYPMSPNEGLTMSLVCRRLIERYKKPMFASAGNEGPATNTVINPAGGDGVIAVGAYISKDTWLANFGTMVEYDDYLANYSARGPREDGAMKPDLVAPTGGITANPAIAKGRFQVGTFELPPGYTLGGGTSQAAPMAAGATALIISAAKQSNVSWEPARLRWALTSGARYLSRLGAYDQGAGLLQVGAAWDLLKGSGGPVSIAVRAPVKTKTSGRLPAPDEGLGLYEREGWRAGQRGDRTITLTRTSGPARAVTYNVRWVGNDGTFTGATTVALPLDVAVPFAVSVAPPAVGIHSALLDLVDPQTNLIASRTLHTVVASQPLSAENGFTARWEGTASRPETAIWCIDVPPDTAALNFELDVAEGIVKPRVQEPNGLSPEERPGGFGGPAYQDGGKWHRAFVRPEPGVWLVLIDNASDLRRREPSATGPLKPARFTLKASALAATISPQVVRLAGDGEQTVQASSKMLPFKPIESESALGSGFTTTATIDASKPFALFELTVPPGAETVRAQVSGVSDARADLDLYLFDCSGKECTLRGMGTRDDAAEQVEVRAPAAGTWKAVIEAPRLPAGSVTFTYDDAIQHPAFGKVRVKPAATDATNGGGATASQPASAGWTSTIRVDVAAEPRAPRALVGWVDVAGEGIDAATYSVKGTPQPGEVIDIMEVKTRPAPLGTAPIRFESATTRRGATAP